MEMIIEADRKSYKGLAALRISSSGGGRNRFKRGSAATAQIDQGLVAAEPSILSIPPLL